MGTYLAPEAGTFEDAPQVMREVGRTVPGLTAMMTWMPTSVSGLIRTLRTLSREHGCHLDRFLLRQRHQATGIVTEAARDQAIQSTWRMIEIGGFVEL